MFTKILIDKKKHLRIADLLRLNFVLDINKRCTHASTVACNGHQFPKLTPASRTHSYFQTTLTLTKI